MIETRKSAKTAVPAFAVVCIRHSLPTGEGGEPTTNRNNYLYRINDIITNKRFPARISGADEAKRSESCPKPAGESSDRPSKMKYRMPTAFKPTVNRQRLNQTDLVIL